jgi:hypothetical protein
MDIDILDGYTWERLLMLAASAKTSGEPYSNRLYKKIRERTPYIIL